MLQWHQSLLGHHKRFFLPPRLAPARVLRKHTASCELTRVQCVKHSAGDMKVSRLAKLFSFFFPFLFPPYSERTAGESGKHSAALLPSALAAARPGKSRILAARVVFPKKLRLEHAAPVAPRAGASLNLEMKSMNFRAASDVKFTHVAGPAEMRGGNIYSADWLVESVYLCS